MKLFELEKEYKIFVDLDGVVADLDKHVLNLTGKTFPQLRKNDKDDGFQNFVNSERKKGHSVFGELDLMPDAKQLWDYIAKYKPSILTATGVPEAQATAEKIQWVMNNLNGYDQIHTVKKSILKAEYAQPNYILIDDREKSIKPWRGAGGIGILHTSAADTISQLQELGL
jgi:hypothetical protein